MNDQGNRGLSAVDIVVALSPYVGVSLSDEQLARIAAYLSVLRKWNRTMPLTSIEGEKEILVRHFGESMFAASLLPMQGGRLADVGSGAGFPGLALKILSDQLQVTLIESSTKKCAFLRELKTTLALSGVEIVRGRYEDVSCGGNSFDFVCSRALGQNNRLLQWAKLMLRVSGHALLWLGMDDSAVVSRIRGWHWELPAKVPESRRRVILVGNPQ